MEKVIIMTELNHFRRFIVLTNKNIYSFTTDDLQADCTMNLILKNCKMGDVADDEMGKKGTLVSSISYTLKSINFLYQSIYNEADGLTYYFQANSELERNEWLRSINLEISNPGVVMEQDEIDWLSTRRLSDISSYSILKK